MPRGRAGGPARRSGTSRAPRPTTSPTRRRAARGVRRLRARAGSTRVPTALADALALVRDAARALLSAFPKESVRRARRDAGRTQARGLGAGDLRERRADGRQRRGRRALARPSASGSRGGDQLCVAPLQVWGPLRDQLLADKTVVLTSATLMLGGDFDRGGHLARPQAERARRPLARSERRPADARTVERRRAAVARHRRRVAVRLRPAGHPVRRQAPAAAGPRRPRARADRRDRRPGRRRRRAARSGCSPAGVPPRPPPRRCASGCRT